MLPLAKDRGVNFAVGTDARTVVEKEDNAVGSVTCEISIQTARAHSYRPDRDHTDTRPNSVSSLKQRYAADLVSVQRSPLYDVTLLEDADNVDFVLE